MISRRGGVASRFNTALPRLLHEIKQKLPPPCHPFQPLPNFPSPNSNSGSIFQGIIAMSTGEAEETQSASGDGGAGGPGAPTPLSVLEVSEALSTIVRAQ